jgi:putative FmdB family regulatory protein
LPIWEYQCTKCDAVVEHFVKDTKSFIAPLHFTETCEAEYMIRIVSKSSFKLKGSGWYKDGYTKPLSNDERRDELNSLKSSLHDTKEAFKAESQNK